MRVYRGAVRRQVGGNIFSTIARGIRPFFTKMLSHIKPHAKELGKKAVKSALNVGTDMAIDAMSGNLSKRKLKSAVKTEAKKMRTDITDKLKTAKRKYLTALGGNQSGSGHKRRRISVPASSKRKARKMPKRRTNAKRGGGKRRSKPRRGYKRMKKQKKHPVKKAIKRRKRRTVKRRDIFG